MPGRSSRYLLSDDVLTAMWALSDRDRRTAYSAFEQVAENPTHFGRTVARDWDGRAVYAILYGGLEIGFVLGPREGEIVFTLLRPAPTEG